MTRLEQMAFSGTLRASGIVIQRRVVRMPAIQ